MRDYYKEAKTILDNHRLYYLKLNITLPKESLKEVTDVYNQKFFVKHRGGDGKGWLSAALHSVNGDYWKTMSAKQYGYKSDSDESIKWAWTDVCDYAPITTEFFKKEFPASGYRRLRYMLLEPSGHIDKHCDAPSKIPYNPRKVDSIFSALNMCITQPEDCELTHIDNGPVPFKPLEIYLFNNDEMHYAFNKSDKNRFHIIAHANYNDDFCKLFVESFEKNHEHIH